MHLLKCIQDQMYNESRMPLVVLTHVALHHLTSVFIINTSMFFVPWKPPYHAMFMKLPKTLQLTFASVVCYGLYCFYCMPKDFCSSRNLKV